MLEADESIRRLQNADKYAIDLIVGRVSKTLNAFD